VAEVVVVVGVVEVGMVIIAISVHGAVAVTGTVAIVITLVAGEVAVVGVGAVVSPLR
jgi:hypothetical protein